MSNKINNPMGTLLEAIVIVLIVLYEINKADNSIILFPNPVNNKLFIAGLNGKLILEINIFNQLGQKVFHKKNISSPLDVSMLNQGIYIIEVKTQNKIKRSKLVKK